MKSTMNKYERIYHNKGYKRVAGVDEVGRGSWAGPIVVASCILPINFFDKRINDSKKISKKKRDELYNVIKEVAIDYNITFINSTCVDLLNPKQATISAMQESLKKLKNRPDMVLVDAEIIDAKSESKSIINGDSKSISIAAASILAKVARDEYMTEMSKKYPMYGFEKNKGYGTSQHLMALTRYGPIKNFHRFSYKPIINVVNELNNK